MSYESRKAMRKAEQNQKSLRKELELDRYLRVDEDPFPSKRVFKLLKNVDLETVSFDNVQNAGNPMYIEKLNRQELFDLCLVNFARLCVVQEWEGLLTGGGGGGGNEFNAELTAYNWNGAEDPVMVAVLPPWGTADRAYQSSGNTDNRIMWPFISPTSGDVSSVVVYVNGNSGGTGAVNIGFYSDDEGRPATFLGEYVIATTVGGQIIQTTASATVTLVRGTQYWIGQFCDTFASQPSFGVCDRQATGTGLSTATSGLHGSNVTMMELSSSGNATISDWTGFIEATQSPINIGVKF